MIGVKNLVWKDNKLFLGKKNSGYSVEYEGEFQFDHFYKVKWPDGVLSEDCYNLTRAKDNAVTSLISDLNMRETDTEAPLVDLNGVGATRVAK